MYRAHTSIWEWLRNLPVLFSAYLCLLLAVAASFPATATAQGPREYLNTPVDQWSGYIDVIFTRSQSAASAGLPLPNDLSVSRTTVPYILYSFPWRKKYAGISFTAPFARIEAANGSLKSSGFTDPAIGLHANIIGLPALKKSELSKYVPKTIVSVHLNINPPLGKYDRNSPVNPGSNRWAFAPLVNLNIPKRKGKAWIEFYAQTKFFTANNEFRGSSKLTQEPLTVISGFFSHNIGKRYWLGAGSNYDNGGRTHINGVAQPNYINGFRPTVAFSAVVSRFRFTVRYENTKTTETASSRNWLLSIRVATLLF